MQAIAPIVAKRRAPILVGVLLAFWAGTAAAEAVVPKRLVFVQSALDSDQARDEVVSVIERAAAAEYTGIVLSSTFDRIALRSDAYFVRLEDIRRSCAMHELELIPAVCSAGWGGGVLAHDCNLAAVVPVRDLPLRVRDGRAVYEPADIEFTNGGFEDHEGHRVRGYELQERPGRVTFVDTDIVHSGRASLRLQSFDRALEYHGRAMQRIATKPFRAYRVSLWLRSAGLVTADGFFVDIRGGDGRVLKLEQLELAGNDDWRRFEVVFNSLDYQRVRLAIGVWQGRAGRAWIDDIRVEEVGLQGAVNRAGAPVVVRRVESNLPLTPDVDYRLGWAACGQAPTIEIVTDHVHEGALLSVSAYQAMPIREQLGVCMGEPKVYDIWREAIRILDAKLKPSTYLLDMDEVRHGGWCDACRSLGTTAGEIFAKCVQAQREIVRAVNTSAQVMIWSDMIDPSHNATDPYHLTNGGYHNAWLGLPNDLIVVCWQYETRDASLAHFHELGYRTLVAVYYDSGSLDNPRGWLQAVAGQANNRGAMYTTWRGDYKWLEPFGWIAARDRLNGQ